MWFSDGSLDDEERHLKVASMDEVWRKRIVRLVYEIAVLEQWIAYDRESRRFSTSCSTSSDAPSPASSPVYTPESSPASSVMLPLHLLWNLRKGISYLIGQA